MVAVKRRRVPFFTVVFAGVIVNVTGVALLIVRSAVAEMLPELAVTVTEPTAMPVASPLASTVAVLPSEELHDAVALISTVLVSSKVPVATYC